MTLRAPVEPRAHRHSDGGNMREHPDDAERLVSTAHVQRILLTDLCITSLKGVARLSFTARNILTHPTLSAPRRALVPVEHSFTVRVLRARRAPGSSLYILLRPRVARAQKIIRPHPLLYLPSLRLSL